MASYMLGTYSTTELYSRALKTSLSSPTDEMDSRGPLSGPTERMGFKRMESGLEGSCSQIFAGLSRGDV